MKPFADPEHGLAAEVGRLEARIAELRGERDRLCSELARERALLQAAIDSAPLPLVVAGPDGAVRQVNRASSDAVGFPTERLAGRNIVSLLAPASREAAREMLRSPDLSPVVGPVRAELLGASGEPLPVELTVRLARGERGERLGLVAAVEDGRKRDAAEIERERVESLEALDTMAIELAAAPFGSDLLDLVARNAMAACGGLAAVVSVFDPAASELTVRHAVARADVPEEPTRRLLEAVRELRLPVGPQRLARMLARVVHTPRNLYAAAFARLPRALAEQLERDLGARGFKGLTLRHGGQLVGTAVVVLPQPTAPLPDETLTVLANMIAVTMRRVSAEQERRQIEARMRQAQRLESLGVLAGGIAHDFNSLLTGILSHASLALADVEPGAPARTSLEQVIFSARRATELTRQMLAFAGHGDFTPAPLDLSAAVEETGPLLEIAISKKAIIEYRLQRDLPPVRADVVQLRQVLTNLVLNAAEAIDARGGRIAISTSLERFERAFLDRTQHEAELPEGLYVCLSVSDDGCGMDEKVLPRIYDPFFSTKFTGRGLGLAAVLGIVQAHGGAIHAESAPGRGTILRVLLPPCSKAEVGKAEVGKAEVGKAEVGKAEVGKAKAAWRGSGTVLVVDDEELVRNFAARILKRAGFEVLLAKDGEEAIARVCSGCEQLRLIVLDSSMPRLDGAETLREIRRLCPKVRAVLSSGYSEQDATSRIPAGELAGFAQKPYGVDDFLAVVRKALGE